MERHTYIRLAKIDSLIRQGAYPNCQKLAEEFETSERTVLRDIEAMKDSLGAPIAYSKEKNGYYYTQGGFCLPEMKLTEGELLAVFLGADILKKYRGAPFEQAIRRAFRKIQVMLPDEITLRLGEPGHVYSFDIQETIELDKKGAEVLARLVRAIENKKKVRMEYFSVYREARTCRTVDPYHLRHALGAWYLIAYCQKARDIRTFNISQIKSLKVLPESFTVPKDFSADKFLAGSWQIEEGGRPTKVVVRLDNKIVRWFKNRRLHPSQKTKENHDGSLDLTFEVAGTNEIKRWIMSLGANARVKEPASLREEILSEARKILS